MMKYISLGFLIEYEAGHLIYSTFSFIPITHYSTLTSTTTFIMNSQITCHPLHFTKTAIKIRPQNIFTLSLAPNLANFALKGHYRCFTITANTCINVFYNIHLNDSLKSEKDPF
jgi:hypothetical protein